MYTLWNRKLDIKKFVYLYISMRSIYSIKNAEQIKSEHQQQQQQGQ